MNKYPIRGSERVSQLRSNVRWSVGNCGHRWLLKHIWGKSGCRQKLSDTKEFVIVWVGYKVLSGKSSVLTCVNGGCPITAAPPESTGGFRPPTSRGFTPFTPVTRPPFRPLIRRSFYK